MDVIRFIGSLPFLPVELLRDDDWEFKIIGALLMLLYFCLGCRLFEMLLGG